MTVLAFNKKASHKYHTLETYEAGVVLYGFEVKAIREGKVDFEGSYIRIIDGKPVLVNLQIGRFSRQGDVLEYDPRRTRQLLLNAKEIEKLSSKTKEKGLTLAPLKLYTDHGLIKLSFAIARGKKEPQRKEELKKKQQDLDLKKAVKSNFDEEF